MIPSLSQTFERVIVITCVLLLFTPKINLLSVQGQTAGIRIDDLLLFLIFILLTAGFISSPRIKVSKIEYRFGIVLMVFIFSNIINLILFSRSNLLYSFRYAEYFLFFYGGYYYAVHYNIRTLAIWLLSANAVIMMLQYFGLIGGFTSTGFTSSSADRLIGLTGGPWEIGAVINFIFAILIFNTKSSIHIVKVIVLFIITFGLILLTGARMPAIAHITLLFLFLYQQSHHKVGLLLKLIIIAPVVLTIILFIPNEVLERSKNLSSFDNITQFIDVFKNVEVSPNFLGFPDMQTSEEGDFSWLMRISKWAYVIKMWMETPFSWFVGLGPGIWGVALDGGWLRLLTESGLIGTVLFVGFFWRVARIAQPMLGVVIALFINMLMIDLQLAYKAMSFVFFCTGYYYASTRQNIVISKKSLQAGLPS